MNSFEPWSALSDCFFTHFNIKHPKTDFLCFFPFKSSVHTQTLTPDVTTPWTCFMSVGMALLMSTRSNTGGAKPTPSRSISSPCCCRCSAFARPLSSQGSPSWVRRRWCGKWTVSLSRKKNRTEYAASSFLHSLFVFFFSPGTISVIYLISLVTIKAVHLGFHLEFHWFDSTQFYVPGKRPADFASSFFFNHNPLQFHHHVSRCRHSLVL